MNDRILLRLMYVFFGISLVSLIVAVVCLFLTSCAPGPTGPSNRVHRFSLAQIPNGTYRGSVQFYFPGRSSSDSLDITIYSSTAKVWLLGLELPCQVDSLTPTAVWLTCRYDDCALWLRTYPGRVGVGSALDSLRGYATLVPDDTTHVYPYHATPGTWRAER